jgi:ferric-dicitrate binding protein FerR (iron transport regulator)
MSTSVPPRDGGALTGSPSSLPPFLADESALRRIFDAEYSALVVTARSQLGDAASQASHVVESAFVDAWKNRADFNDATQVKAFLADDVHHGAARALSRRAAAHRFGTHGGRDDTSAVSHESAPGAGDADAAWERITHGMHADTSAAAAHVAAASLGRHDAAEHMKAIAKRPSWIAPVAIGVGALVISAAGMVYFDRLGEDDATLSAVSRPDIQPIQSSPGQIGSLTLADGTRMRIGPDTKVFKAEGFPTKVRAVRVEGTAQFDVAPNQPLPFRVVAKRTQTIATGTSFVVSAYPGDSTVLVQVREGTVTVKAGKQSSTVAMNQALAVNGTTLRAAKDDERAEAFGWVDGQMTVSHKQLREVVGQLTRWFNLDIKVPDLQLLDREASVSVSLDSSRAAIAQVEKSANVKFTYEGDSKVFRDATVKK